MPLSRPSRMMSCTNCYRVNPSGATFCYYCGSRLATAPAAEAADSGSWAGDADGTPSQPASVSGSGSGNGGWISSPAFGATSSGNPTHGAMPNAGPAYGAASSGNPSYGAASSGNPSYGAMPGANRGYGVPRPPDAVYYPDGTIAVAVPQRGGRRVGGGRNAFARLLAPLAPLLYLLGKLKFLFVFSKIGLTAITMLVSVVAYASLWGLGWAAAIGFVILLFIHEMGHWVVMRAKGVASSAPIFVPFLGAVISMRGMPRSVKDEAEIGIAGPIAGTAASLACIGLGNLYGGHLWPLLGAIGLFLNLFNLLPVSPLDGGRIVAAISRWLWPVGLVGLVALFLWSQNPFLLFIGVIGGIETIARFRGRYGPTSRPGYYDVSSLQRLTMGALYFGLVAVIAVALFSNPTISMG